jgi:4a-hydroxytetrahydrobiopterin dehydratase
VPLRPAHTFEPVAFEPVAGHRHYNDHMAANALSDSELQTELDRLPAWNIQNGKLHRTYKFTDFVQAWGFMSMAALHAEKVSHHPDWSNVYNRVTVELTTHDAGGITQQDVRFAEHVESLSKLFV